MSEISATQVRQLREATGAGMMDCKKALAETKGDLESAVDWLRKKGLAAAAKKAGRAASEGLVAVAVSGTRGALAEVNSETDFVARNPLFQAFARAVAELALGAGGDVEKLKAAKYPGSGRTVDDEAKSLVASIGENIQVRRTAILEVGKGAVAAYVHNQAALGLGKIGVLIGIESTGDTKAVGAVGKQLAMHVAAAAPLFARIDDVDPAARERERAVLVDQAGASGKAEEFIAKMVEGRLRKWYEDVVLSEQVFVIDGETKISKVLANAAKDAGAPVAIKGFIRFAVGEGVEKRSADFADEVAKLAR
ncbi:MAG: elongation factor Ts [Alphaproteobacteria bacterium]|nr:elongation factor Ts [Alphaproteobacteria bacterium]